MKRIAVAGIVATICLMVPSLFVMAQVSSRVSSPHKKMSQACETCHISTSFKQVRFKHDTTRFPLEGHHEKTTCLLCHSIEDFSKATRDCQGCHRDVHMGRLGDECEQCHTPQGWTTFDASDIHSRSEFPLMGRHVLVDCESCHPGQAPDELRHTPTDCINCHRQDYLDVNDPDHVGNGFSTQCDECHEPTGWRPARMPDHDVFFPIFSGTHRGEWDGCVTCHTDPANKNVFSCLNCHAHEEPATSAVHGGLAGYSYDSGACYGCHPTGESTNFVEHDAQFFPIYSGSHKATWDNCAVCHDDPGNRGMFTCLQCHEHEQPTMDARHVGFAGYNYSSDACLSCHPTGEAADFVEHDAQFFPIFSGTHNATWESCNVCHDDPGNRSVFNCLQCHEHGQSLMDGVHTGFTGYSYTSDACYGCHPTGEAARFVEHDAQFFPIFSGTHNGVWGNCSTCHTTPADRSVFSCVDCHAHERTTMDAAHPGIPGYAYDSGACYGCHPTGTAGNFVDHDAQFFPIYSGTHNNRWDSCATCHDDPTQPYLFTCFNCHAHSQDRMDAEHANRNNYRYDSNACLDCHPRGR